MKATKTRPINTDFSLQGDRIERLREDPEGTSALRKDVAERYEVPPGRTMIFVCSEFGRVDLSQVDLTMAERLAEKGYLKKLSLQGDRIERPREDPEGDS